MGLVAKIALALGVDGLVRRVLGALVTLICVSLLVALIVVETVATVLTGGQAEAQLQPRQHHRRALYQTWLCDHPSMRT